MFDDLVSRVGPGALSHRTVVDRLVAVVDLVGAVPDDVSNDAMARLEAGLAGFTPAEFWLAFALVRRQYPVPAEVRRLYRAYGLDGASGVIDRLRSASRRTGAENPEVVSDQLLVDVSGIADGSALSAKVALDLLVEWASVVDLLPVVWAADSRCLRTLDRVELVELGLPAADTDVARVVVPHHARYVLLGTVDLPRAAERIIALGLYSDNDTATVGFGLDLLLDPHAHTRHDGKGRFSWHLAAQRSLARLVSVGTPSAHQYRGWQQMLAALGMPGPRISTVPLPGEVGVSGDQRRVSSFAHAVAADLQLL